LGKALGGGMPLGAFIADKKLMNTLTHDPVLGHITTFGGHPVSCTAGKAAMEVLLEQECIAEVKQKEQYLLKHLVHPLIKAIRSAGLWMAIEFDSFEINHAVIQHCIAKGLITDWFLFAPQCMRLAPPLITKENELENICRIIAESLAALDL
jgi:acetylornithine/succinyldiaminopimelate/putrescine aminotransferase